METIFEVLYIIFGSAMVLCFLLLIPYTLTVGRHFDKWFRDKEPVAMSYMLFPFPGLSYVVRAIVYGRYIVLPFLTKNTLERKYIYKNFNFKQHANKFHLIFSYIFIYQIVIMAITTILMMTVKALIWLMKNGIFITTT